MVVGAYGRRLDLGERARLTAEIVVAYVQARKELRSHPIATVVENLRRESDRGSALRPETLEEARRLGNTVTRILRMLPGDTRCLARSLVLTRLMARRGIPATLVIGARTTPSFLAHAWVECAGIPVLTPGDGSFGRLTEL
ncbi:MAG TPA: lasso peptide biosynthesis B2 protein [Solirubrobacteraceae bacterium]